MPQSTSAKTERTATTQLELAPLLAYSAGDELGLITSEVAARTGALTGLLFAWNVANQQLDLVSASGTVSAADRVSMSASESGFGGRVLAAGHVIAEVLSPAPSEPLAMAASGASVMYAIGVPVYPPGLAPSALCIGLAAEPRDPRYVRETAAADQPVSIRIDGGAGAPRRARTSVLSRLEGRLAGKQLADASLMVSELVTNSVLHANVSSEQTLTVELMTLTDRLRITVIDAGSDCEPCLQPPDHESPGGFGLFLVEELSDAWGVVRDGGGTTRVWCELLLAAPAPAGP